MAHIKISKDPSLHPDQCAWYFINFCIDTFFGIALVFFFVRTVEKLARECGYRILAESGNYGSSENPSCKIFSIQLFVFLLITLLVKFILALLVWPLSGPLGRFGIWLFATPPIPRTRTGHSHGDWPMPDECGWILGLGQYP